MHRTDSGNTVRPEWLMWLLQRGVPLLVLLMSVLEHIPICTVKKTEFTRVQLTGCSTWTTIENKQQCIVLNPNLTTVVSVVAPRDYDLLYFDLLVTRRYARPYWRGNYQRIEFEGQVKRDSSSEFRVVPRDDSYLQGSDADWRQSYPRRLAWAKNVKRGQNITFELDSLRIFFDIKPNQAAHDYGRTGIVEFLLFAEADDHSLIPKIFWIKTLAFVAVLPLVGIMLYRSEKGLLPVLNSVLLAIAGTTFLCFTRPRTEELAEITPEEYFSDNSRLMWNYASFLCFETAMGIQAVLETIPPGSRVGKLVWPLILLGFPFLWYARHAHDSDFRGSAQAYFNGGPRARRQDYFQAYTVKGLYLSSVPCLIISLTKPWRGPTISLVSIFIGYTMVSFTVDRHVMALFSTWKFARDLMVWVLGFLYLVFWTPEQPATSQSQSPGHGTEEEQLPIAAT